VYYAPGPRVMGYPSQRQVLNLDTEPETPLRMVVGLEGEGFLSGGKGFSLGLLATVEGEHFGVSIYGSHLAVGADDGTNSTDTLQQLNAHLTYAFLTGPAGRLRGEFGIDTVFAADITTIGPTAGLSGSLWQFSPLAIEGSFNVTPYPFLQLDGRLGVAYGFESIGLRAGYRIQMLDDRGLADGVVHRDVFGGPYVGVSVVL
jgi:hypothetical protein